MPQIFLIGGPNGAGKTTAALGLLPGLLKCDEYVNADTIASGLSTFHPESAAIQSGRLMLKRIHYLADYKKDFAFETTLSSLTFIPFLKKCKSQGYDITLVFLWLRSPDLALRRVASRVQNGGHYIPREIIIRRYHRGLSNFFKFYLPLVDNWVLYDNSGDKPIKIAQKILGESIIIHKDETWKTLQTGSIALPNPMGREPV